MSQSAKEVVEYDKEHQAWVYDDPQATDAPTDRRTGVERFNDWFLPFAREELRKWRERHPLR